MDDVPPREDWGPDFAVDRVLLPWPMLRAWNGAASRKGPAPVLHRRGGRVVECARLESVCRATYRGFKSLILRGLTIIFISNPSGSKNYRILKSGSSGLFLSRLARVSSAILFEMSNNTSE